MNLLQHVTGQLDGAINQLGAELGGAIAHAIRPPQSRQTSQAANSDDWERVDAEEWRPDCMKKRGALEMPILNADQYIARLRSKREGLQYYALYVDLIRLRARKWRRLSGACADIPASSAVS